jgi:hypothetical protein
LRDKIKKLQGSMATSSIHIKFFQSALLVALVGCCEPGTAVGTTYDRSPRPTILLSDSERLIAQDSWDSVTLYRVKDAAVVRRFPAGSGIEVFALTPDEQLLVLACEEGSLSAWDVETGQRAWQQSPWQSGLSYVYDASFAQDGQSVIVCDERDQAVIYESRTGQRIGAVRFPRMQTNIMSAALSADGTSGVLIDLGERLFTFDVKTGRLTDTDLKGAWPVRYSVDGNYLAFRSSNSGTSEQLRVVAVKEQLAKRDIGQFSYIRNIRPTKEGSFLVSARVGGRFAEDMAIVGVQVWPGTGGLQEVWRRPAGKDVNEKTDFALQTMIGVSTDFRLVTHLTDLRTGASLWSADNSANYRPTVVSYTSRDVMRTGWVWLACGAGGFAVFGLLVLVIRRRRLRSRLAFGHRPETGSGAPEIQGDR